MTNHDYETVAELRGKTVVFAGSGGLDSMTCTSFLKENGANVIVMSADLGQPDEEDINDIGERMLACGVDDFVLLPLKEQLADAAVKMLQGMGKYEGGYWNTTGLARHVIVAGIIEEMKKRGLNILAHGCTGRGNDQFRFQWCAHHLDPEIKLYAPWRDEVFTSLFPGRKEMIEYCEAKGLPIRHSSSKPYSTDANLLGLTHEAGDLEYLTTPVNLVEPEMMRRAEDAPDSAETFSVKFEKGVPTHINESPVSRLDAFLRSNEIAGKHGVGLRHVVENRIVPFKSRGVYEQPGIELLGVCYEFLLQVLLDRDSRDIFEVNSRILGGAIYDGKAFDLAARMAFAATAPLTDVATGVVTVELYKGNVRFVSIKDAPYSLYDEEATSMEKTDGGFNHHDSGGMIRIGAQSARNHSRLGMTRRFF
jgi:argininosuccinate synthase